MANQSRPAVWLLCVLAALIDAASCSKGLGRSERRRDPVAECREIAPRDPIGVEDREGAEKAYSVCREAASRAPNDAEVAYALGASALQSYRAEEAVASFTRAVQLGSCGAHYFLGDEAWRGRKNVAEAEGHFKSGAECGDERSAREVSPRRAFDGSGRMELAEALYAGDMKRLNRSRFLTASYVSGFYEALSEQYLGKEFDICWTTNYYKGADYAYGLSAAEKGDASNVVESYLYERSLPVIFRLLLPEQGTLALEEFRKTERKAGHADAIRMAENSKCGSLFAFKVVQGIEEFSKAKRTLFEVVQEALPNLRSLQDLSDWLRQQPGR